MCFQVCASMYHGVSEDVIIILAAMFLLQVNVTIGFVFYEVFDKNGSPDLSLSHSYNVFPFLTGL